MRTGLLRRAQKLTRIKAELEPETQADYRPAVQGFSDQRRFADQVIKRLTSADERIAVVDAYGKPAMVSCRERLFDVLSRDHDIVGVYKAGARAIDVIEDLQAAGL